MAGKCTASHPAPISYAGAVMRNAGRGRAQVGGSSLLDMSDDEVPQAHADVPAFALAGEPQRDFALGDDHGGAGLHDPGVGLGLNIAAVELADVVDLGELAVALDAET